MLSGSYQSPNNENNSHSVSSSTKGISVTVVMEDKEKDEDTKVEIMIPKLAPLFAGTVHSRRHIPAYNMCKKSGKECTRMPGHTCDSCIKLKTRYSKSTGRGGKPRKEVMADVGPKGKVKVKVKENEKIPGTHDFFVSKVLI